MLWVFNSQNFQNLRPGSKTVKKNNNHIRLSPLGGRRVQFLKNFLMKKEIILRNRVLFFYKNKFILGNSIQGIKTEHRLLLVVKSLAAKVVNRCNQRTLFFVTITVGWVGHWVMGFRTIVTKFLLTIRRG